MSSDCEDLRICSSMGKTPPENWKRGEAPDGVPEVVVPVELGAESTTKRRAEERMGGSSLFATRAALALVTNLSIRRVSYKDGVADRPGLPLAGHPLVDGHRREAEAPGKGGDVG